MEQLRHLHTRTGASRLVCRCLLAQVLTLCQLRLLDYSCNELAAAAALLGIAKVAAPADMPKERMQSLVVQHTL